MAKLTGAKDKDTLLKMAETWEECAREAERKDKS
jgi:hypothetical protein